MCIYDCFSRRITQPGSDWNPLSPAGENHGASQVALVVKNLPANSGNAGNWGSISGLRRFPGGGDGNPLQHPRLENPMDRGAWRATIHGVTQSPNDRSDLACMHFWQEQTIAQHFDLCRLRGACGSGLSREAGRLTPRMWNPHPHPGLSPSSSSVTLNFDLQLFKPLEKQTTH